MIVETEIKLTPKQLAEEFWNMYSDEQAEFFAELFNAAGMGESYYNLSCKPTICIIVFVRRTLLKLKKLL